MAQFIYTMQKVRKAHGDKVILDDVTLAFLPGAKIGVVGPNGAGKSSVLKIMAGLDQPSNGDASLADGATVGLLQQEPPLDETKTVRENVEVAVADLRATLARFEEVSAADGRTRRRLRLAAGRAGRAAWRRSSTPRAGSSTAASSRPWTRCAARPATRRSPTCPAASGAASRCASCCSRRRTCCCSTSRPTTWTPRACSGSSSTWPSTPARSWPSPTTGTSWTTSPQWILELDRGRAYPYEGNYSTYLEKKAERLTVAGQEGPEAAEATARGAGLGAAERQGPAGEEQVAPAALRGDGGRGREDPQARLRGDPDPAGPAPGQRRGRGRSPRQGLRRRAADEGPVVLAAARRHRRRHRARTASARPRCSR